MRTNDTIRGLARVGKKRTMMLIGIAFWLTLPGHLFASVNTGTTFGPSTDEDGTFYVTWFKPSPSADCYENTLDITGDNGYSDSVTLTWLGAESFTHGGVWYSRYQFQNLPNGSYQIFNTMWCYDDDGWETDFNWGSMVTAVNPPPQTDPTPTPTPGPITVGQLEGPYYEHGNKIGIYWESEGPGELSEFIEAIDGGYWDARGGSWSRWEWTFECWDMASYDPAQGTIEFLDMQHTFEGDYYDNAVDLSTQTGESMLRVTADYCDELYAESWKVYQLPGAPAAPSNVTGTVDSDGSATLSWTGDNLAYYRIEELQGGSWVPVATEYTQLSIDVGTRAAGSSVTFRVQAYYETRHESGNPFSTDSYFESGWHSVTVNFAPPPPTVGKVVPPYYPAFWNNSTYTRLNNNCYNYALNVVTNDVAQPAWAADDDGFADPANQTCAGLISSASSDTRVTAISSLTQVGEGETAVAAFIRPAAEPSQANGWRRVVPDFHFYRRDSDGYWSHKDGQQPATNLDASGNTITDPRNANRGEYTQFCGYLKTYSFGRFNATPEALQNRGYAVIAGGEYVPSDRAIFCDPDITPGAEDDPFCR